MGRVVGAAARDGRDARRAGTARRSCRSRITGRPRSPRSATQTPVPSAQVKSAILLAGLAADGETAVSEAVATRDHTERMLRARGVAVDETTEADGAHTVARRRARRGRRHRRDRSRPTRRAPRSGWSPARSTPTPSCGSGGEHEPDAACHHRHPAAHGRGHRGDDRSRVGRGGRRDPSPTSWSVPARSGASTSRPPTWPARSTRSRSCVWPPRSRRGRRGSVGAGELRHKESDRIAGHRGRPRALGARVRVEGDDIEIQGGRRLRGAVTETHDDHRLAMTFSVAGLIAEGETTVLRPGSAAISYPGFFANSKGCEHDEARRPHRPPGGAFAVRRDAAGGLRPCRHRRAYELWDRPPIALADAIAELRTDDFLGANVTIPHKERVVPQVDRLTEEAHATGAVNTLTKEGRKLVGHNTDVPGSRSPSTRSSAARRCRARRWCWAPAAARGPSSTA